MPSLQMKRNSLADSPKENNGLHVCQKSSKISKNSFSHVRKFQHEAELDTFTPKKQDGSFCSNATVQEIRSDGTNCCEMAVEEIVQVHKHDQANFTTVETIFSPILESIDNDIEPNIDNYEGTENDIILQSCGDNDMNGNKTVSDFIISDMISSIERNSTCLLDYEWDEYMLLPFLEDSIETNIHNEDTSIYSKPAIVSEGNQESDINSYPDWDPAECLDPQMFIRNFLDFSEVSTSFGPTSIPHESRQTKSITLVLDLDETLVHSSLEHCDGADFTFQVFAGLKEHTVYVKQRPYLRVFLERVSEMFHIAVFTASQSIYANKLLDILDPDGKFISRRAYRDSCIFSDGSYTKDLTVLDLDLAKVVIIDNSPQVFRLQVNNGIPIKSWFDDPSDCALISLLPFLETLVDAEDVRPIIAKRFGNKD